MHRNLVRIPLDEDTADVLVLEEATQHPVAATPRGTRIVQSLFCSRVGLRVGLLRWSVADCPIFTLSPEGWAATVATQLTSSLPAVGQSGASPVPIRLTEPMWENALLRLFGPPDDLVQSLRQGGARRHRGAPCETGENQVGRGDGLFESGRGITSSPTWNDEYREFRGNSRLPVDRMAYGDPADGGTDTVRSTSHGSLKQEASTFGPDMG